MRGMRRRGGLRIRRRLGVVNDWRNAMKRVKMVGLLVVAMLAGCKGSSEMTPEQRQAAREKAHEAMDAIPLAQRRGFEQTGDGSPELAIVKAPLDKLTDAVLKGNPSKVVVSDALGKDVEILDQSYLLMQLKGHPWTAIIRLSAGATKIPELAKALSSDLQTEAISYRYSDFSGSTHYALYDSGNEIETLVDTDKGVTFNSSRRQITADEKEDVELYLDRALKAEDAYLPEIGGYEAPPGKTQLPPDYGYKPEEVEGTVFVAGKNP